MRRFLSRTAALLVAGLAAAAALHAQAVPPPDHPFFTAPVRERPVQPFDQQHLRLALRFSPAEGRLFGDARLSFLPLQDSLPPLVLFAADLAIDSVAVGPAGGPLLPAPFRRGAADSLLIPLDALVPPPDSLSAAAVSVEGQAPFEVRISYAAQPKKGLYFIPPPEEAAAYQIWTQGEPEDNRHWFPVFDVPADKLTTEILATVDPEWEVLSNGRLVARTDDEDGDVTYHYALDQPHAPYLVSLVAGDFAVRDGAATLASGQRIPLAYWVAPERAGDAARTFGRTPEMVRFFSDRLGHAFPWPQYAQAAVRGYHFGGMENTGATTLTDRVLVDERAVLDADPDGLIAHELAHQWFGDLVTARYWSDIWLHEGFATYLAALFERAQEGDTSFALQMAEDADAYFREAAEYRRPLVWNRWYYPLQLFDAHSYRKGAWVLHMLRHALGDEAFWRVLQHYLDSHPYGAVTTQDFAAAVKEAAGLQAAPFFDQWVFSAGHPVLDVHARYDRAEQALVLTVAQTQQGYLVPEVFELDLVAEIHTLSDSTRFRMHLDERTERFTFPLEMPPRFVLIDPEQTLLAETQVEQDAGAWAAQLRYAPYAVSRLRAARALARFEDDPALLVALRSALESEAVAAVRAAIVETVGMLPPSPAAKRILLGARSDSSPAVRAAALTGLGAYENDPDVAGPAFASAQQDPSYRVQAAAVLALARSRAPGAADVVRSALVTPSHREVIRRAAFEALPYLDLPAAEALDLGLSYSAPGQPADVRIAAIGFLQTLAGSSRRALDRLLEALDDPSYRVRQAAIQALGETEADDARRALEVRLHVEPQPQLAAAIEQAIRRHEALRP